MDTDKLKRKLKTGGELILRKLRGMKGPLAKRIEVPVWVLLCVLLCVFAVSISLFLRKSSPGGVGEEAPAAGSEAKSGVFAFNYGSETSRVFVTFSGKDRQEVTEYVTGSSAGSLFLDPDGICRVLALERKEVSEEEEADFRAAADSEDIFLSETGELLKLTDGERTVILMEDSPLYLLNGVPARLGASVIRKDGRLSVPLSYLAFDFGITSISTGTEGDSVTYTLVR